MRRAKSRLLMYCVVLLTVWAAAGGWYVLRPLPMRQPIVDFEIAKGASMKQVANTVADAGIDVSPLVLTWLARLSGHSVRIKAGSYRIEQPMNIWNLVMLMSSGANSYSDMTVIEGWNFVRLRRALAEQGNMVHDAQSLTDAQIMERLGAPLMPPEGMFAPDTYSFSRGSSEMEVLRRAFGRMQSLLQDEWNSRQSGLPLKTPYEALVLASIIEKETARPQDRGLIASVFINRLRIGMPLQSDPTVIYGLGSGFDGNLRRRDLQTDSPFNSYTRAGLPPTPIAMPGAASLHSVLHPAESQYLYFVARGDGSSEFSRSLEEHNRAVARYQKAGRK